MSVSRIPAPVLQCFQASLGRNSRDQWHDHSFHEIVHCVHGWGVQYAEDKRWPVKPGDTFFLPGDLNHAAASETSEGCLLAVLYLRRDAFQHHAGHGIAPSVLRYLHRRAEAGQCDVPLTAESQGRLRQLFSSMIEEDKARHPGHAMAAALLVEQMMLLLMRDPHHRPAFEEYLDQTEQGGRIDRVRAYIETHYSQTLPVEDMAAMASLGRSQFHAAFKAATGETLVEYVQRVRVDRARELLAEGEASILQIAMRCGFGNLSHFYHVFKAHTGQPPGAFARSAAADDSA
jgi:AraC-like DNA-binding protein/quercetin dioxygenase-like cupin family protein